MILGFDNFAGVKGFFTGCAHQFDYDVTQVSVVGKKAAGGIWKNSALVLNMSIC